MDVGLVANWESWLVQGMITEDNVLALIKPQVEILIYRERSSFLLIVPAMRGCPAN